VEEWSLEALSAAAAALASLAQKVEAQEETKSHILEWRLAQGQILVEDLEHNRSETDPAIAVAPVVAADSPLNQIRPPLP